MKYASNPDKQAQIEKGLERAAETIGDINQPVMDRYYRTYPEARQSFLKHGLGATRQLENEMMDNVLYCLMMWFERPAEIVILLGTSIPHHEETLDVDHSWYSGLISAAIDVITGTIPAANDEEHAIWAEMSNNLTDIITSASLSNN